MNRKVNKVKGECARSFATDQGLRRSAYCLVFAARWHLHRHSPAPMQPFQVHFEQGGV